MHDHTFSSENVRKDTIKSVQANVKCISRVHLSIEYSQAGQQMKTLLFSKTASANL